VRRQGGGEGGVGGVGHAGPVLRKDPSVPKPVCRRISAA